MRSKLLGGGLPLGALYIDLGELEPGYDNAAMIVAEIEAVANQSPFALFTPARPDNTDEANHRLVRYLWGRLWKSGLEAHEAPAGLDFVDLVGGRRLMTAAPSVLVVDDGRERFRETIESWAERSGAGEVVFYDPVIGFSAPFEPDGQLLEHCAMFAAELSPSLRLKVVELKREPEKISALFVPPKC